LYSYVIKLNKGQHLLSVTFLKSPDSLTHPVLNKSDDSVVLRCDTVLLG